MATQVNTSPPTCPRVDSPGDIIQALLLLPAGHSVSTPRHLVSVCPRTRDIIVTPTYYSVDFDSTLPFGISYRLAWYDPAMLDHLQQLLVEGGAQ